jgi:hypothetical protein
MMQRDAVQNGVDSGDRQSPMPEAAAASATAPPWLAASVAECRVTQRHLLFIRPIRAAAFGGTLVFVAVLAFLFRHSPAGQSVLLILSLFGLPICFAAWLVASSAQRRLRRRRHHIERRLYGVGLHLDDQGRVLTDNPHPILILNSATSRISNVSSPSVMRGA